MAAKVFKLTSSYDNLISNWMHKNKHNINIINHEKKSLRYGENPHQKSFFYKNKFDNYLFNNCIQQNRQLSFNNILDTNSAYECLSEFSEPTCIIVKHSTPCAVASDSKIERAFLKAYKADSISAFGGIVALNRKISEKTAHLLASKFFEVIIAPSFNKNTKNIFKKIKRLILIETKNINKENKLEIKSVNGGFLVQEKNLIIFSKRKMRCVSYKKATDKKLNDLIFAFKVSKYSKSNAIVLVHNKQTIGIGSGQTSRIESTKIALSKISPKYKNIGFVSASDSFFPFIDSLKILINKNCKAIIQPAGSINDNKIINYANSKKIPLYFSQYRFFRH